MLIHLSSNSQFLPCNGPCCMALTAPCGSENHFAPKMGKFSRHGAWPDLQSQLASCQREAEQLLAEGDPDLLAYLQNCGNKLTAVIAGREKSTGNAFPRRLFRSCGTPLRDLPT